jgi:hypothetical protein
MRTMSAAVKRGENDLLILDSLGIGHQMLSNVQALQRPRRVVG